MLALVQTLYTAEVTAQNGRNGHVRSSDGSVDLDLSAPPALGGTGKPGANPEQLFAAGYSACFIGAMQYQAMQQKLRPGDITIDAKVSIGPAEGDNGFTLAVALDVHVAGLDQAAAEKLVADAHRTCPYSNATRGNILVKLTATAAPNASIGLGTKAPVPDRDTSILRAYGNRPAARRVPPSMPAILIDLPGRGKPGLRCRARTQLPSGSFGERMPAAQNPPPSTLTLFPHYDEDAPDNRTPNRCRCQRLIDDQQDRNPVPLPRLRSLHRGEHDLFTSCRRRRSSRSWSHRGEHARMPFQVDDDLLTISNLQHEAIAAGLKHGDRLLEMRGVPYYAAPADRSHSPAAARTSCIPAMHFAVLVRRVDGSQSITPPSIPSPARPLAQDLQSRMGHQSAAAFPPLICLLIGYWVVAARIRDPNAWLLLVLFAFPSVLSLRPNWWPGTWALAGARCYDLLQVLMAPGFVSLRDLLP